MVYIPLTEVISADGTPASFSWSSSPGRKSASARTALLTKTDMSSQAAHKIPTLVFILILADHSPSSCTGCARFPTVFLLGVVTAVARIISVGLIITDIDVVQNDTQKAAFNIFDCFFRPPQHGSREVPVS